MEPYRERFYNTGPLINISLNESYRHERNHLIHCGVKDLPSILQYSLCLIIYIYIFLQGKGCPSHHGVLVQVHDQINIMQSNTVLSIVHIGPYIIKHNWAHFLSTLFLEEQMMISGKMNVHVVVKLIANTNNSPNELRKCSCKITVLERQHL